jgi:dTDP-glucose 4,6-dehydratase
MIEYVKDRPGHDFRYSLDCSKLKEFGWEPEYSFEEALEKTVKWYIENKRWWEKLKH